MSGLLLSATDSIASRLFGSGLAGAGFGSGFAGGCATARPTPARATNAASLVVHVRMGLLLFPGQFQGYHQPIVVLGIDRQVSARHVQGVAVAAQGCVPVGGPGERPRRVEE